MTDYSQAGTEYARRCAANGETAVHMQNGPYQAQLDFNNSIVAEQRRQEDARRAAQQPNDQK